MIYVIFNRLATSIPANEKRSIIYDIHIIIPISIYLFVLARINDDKFYTISPGGLG
jgi:hypothetical protein